MGANRSVSLTTYRGIKISADIAPVKKISLHSGKNRRHMSISKYNVGELGNRFSRLCVGRFTFTKPKADRLKG